MQDLPVASALLAFPSSPKYFELYTLLYSTTLSYIHNCVKLKIKSDWGRGRTNDINVTSKETPCAVDAINQSTVACICKHQAHSKVIFSLTQQI